MSSETTDRDKILSVDDIRGTLKKMKEGVKTQPELMKSTEDRSLKRDFLHRR